jgi:hypothetical protein
MMRRLIFATVLLAAPITAQTPPPPPAGPVVLVPYEAVNPNQPEGDKLGPARRLAAAIVAQDVAPPKQITDVGSFTGEFLEAFLEQFPTSKGQWTEPVDNNRVNAGRRLGRFGERVSYVIGCPSRDLTKGCVPAGTDVLISSWVTIHQPLEGVRQFHREAAKILPRGGWVVVIDHAATGSAHWDARLKSARAEAVKLGLAVKQEGPPVHHPDFVQPTLDQQLDAMRQAGFTNVRVVWQRLDTVMMMGRKE